MTTKKKTLNFGDKSCRIIYGEKNTLRIINILNRKISIYLRKILKFLGDLLSSLKKTNMSLTYKIKEGVK